MVGTMATRGELRSAPRPRSGDDTSTFLSRWLKVWVILLTVVVLVVVVYLIIITNTLASIDDNLAIADSAVAGAQDDTSTLQSQVDRINASLEGIDPALDDIPAQADEIIRILDSVNNKLTATDASLKDTSSVLITAAGTAGTISNVLIDADDPPDGLGVQNIHRRVAAVNGQGSPSVGSAAGGGGCGEYCQAETLTTAEVDARNILAGLVSVNGHLSSICNSVGATAAAGGNCP